MSSLMVSNDLDIMMLEFAVEKLYVPKTSIFDDVIMKRTTVMFRMLDYDWTAVNPHRIDYVPYQGSNLEEENFYGGKSIVFAMPSASLERKMKGVDIQIHVRKNISRYFEMDSCQNVGITLVNVDALFNGIIKELREREELKEYLSCLHKRQPISRSLKGSYEILDENQRITGASIELYVRLSYFGKSVITEIDTSCGIRRAFYAQEETNQGYPYQFKELSRSDLEGGCWGSGTFLSPVSPDQLACYCDTWDNVHEQLDNRSDHSDDEKGDRDADIWGSQASKEARYSTVKRSSTDGKGRRSSDRTGHGKGKPGGRTGKKYRVPSEIVENDGGVEVAKKKRAKKDEKGGKGVKGGDVIKGTREEDSPGEASHPSDRMEIFKDDSDNRRGDAKEIERKTVKERKSMSREEEGGSPSSDKKRGRRSTDDDGKASVRAKGQVGNGRKVGKTGGAYVDEKKGKKRSDGINAAAGKVEKLESVKDGRTKGDSKDQKPLGESRDQTAVTTTTMPADGVGLPGESPSDAKQTLVDAGGSTSTSEYIKRREQLRKRRRGVVTVGFDDKEKKICHEAPPLPLSSPTSLILSDSTPLGLCSNLHYRPSCCYPWPSAGNASLYLPHACFMDTRRERPDRLFTRLNPANVVEMEILTN